MHKNRFDPPGRMAASAWADTCRVFERCMYVDGHRTLQALGMRHACSMDFLENVITSQATLTNNV